MICPKCGHNNNQEVSCTQCGIIFEKYLQQQQRQRVLEQEQWEREDRKKQKLLLVGGVVLGIVLLSSLFFLLPSDSTPEVSGRQTGGRDTSMEYYPWERGTTPGYWERNGSQLNWVPTPGQPTLTELASKFVKTGTRNQIGFIVTDDCHVVFSGDLTQKKNSRDSERRSNYQTEYDLLLERLEDAEQRFEKKRLDFVNNCKVCDDEAFRSKLGREISKLDKLKADLARTREQLDNLNNRLHDADKLRVYNSGFSTTARIVEKSNRYPLSLLVLDRPSCKNLNLGNPDNLQPQERVFTLTGMSLDRLYGGQFTGRGTSPGNAGYLLHDIRLDKGDYGTPLFDQEGNVLGITTAPHNGKQRAIPIDVALRELNLLL